MQTVEICRVSVCFIECGKGRPPATWCVCLRIFLESFSVFIFLGLVQCGKKALLQLSPTSNLLKSWEMLCKNFQNCNIHCIMEYVSHSKLFPFCQAVVHHGGSGTVGMALKCGIPQIVCPFMFDQSYWGDKVAWMGVGETVGHPRSLKAEAFAAALVSVASDDIQKMAVSYSKMLAAEEGMEFAVQQLRTEFSTLWWKLELLDTPSLLRSRFFWLARKNRCSSSGEEWWGTSLFAGYCVLCCHAMRSMIVFFFPKVVSEWVFPQMQFVGGRGVLLCSLLWTLAHNGELKQNLRSVT